MQDLYYVETAEIFSTLHTFLYMSRVLAFHSPHCACSSFPSPHFPALYSLLTNNTNQTAPFFYFAAVALLTAGPVVVPVSTPLQAAPADFVVPDE